MKYYKYLLFLIISGLILLPSRVAALTSSEYRSRHVCENYEVAIAKEARTGDYTSTYADTIGCYNNYNDAFNAMIANSNRDAIIFERRNGVTKIVNAKYALLDLTVGGGTTYYYPNTTTTAYDSYMVNSESTGAVEGALLDFDINSRRAKVKVSGYTGWVNENNYEVVPLIWIYSIGFYKATDNRFKHNFAKKISNPLSYYYGIEIGMIPDGLKNGKNYYSYDSHYYYDDQYVMIDDYKNNTHNRAVNSNTPYYNYYQYLPNHSKTNYSATNINQYIRDGLGFTKNVFGNTLDIKGGISVSNVSKLYGMGTYYIYAQEQYGANAILSLGLSRNESADGRSNIAVQKNNGYGQGAVDSSPFGSAYGFLVFNGSIYNHAQHFVTDMYENPNHAYYNGGHFGNKQGGWNIKYASDPFWGEKAAAYYFEFDKYYGYQDYNFYQLAVSKASVVARSEANNNSKAVYTLKNVEIPVIVVQEVVGETVNGSNIWYKIISDLNVNSNKDAYGSYAELYDWKNSYVYVPSSYFTKINKAKSGLKDVTDVYPYQGQDYKYSYYNNGEELTPKVGKSIRNTTYYYDGGLSESTNTTLLKDKYVMVYDRAVDKNNNVVSYLVTSDYLYDQKEWVNASDISLVGGTYAKQAVVPVGYGSNVLREANENSGIISRIYDGCYIPVLEEKVGSDGKTYLKVPVSITSDNNSYGYTLKDDYDAHVTMYKDTTVAVNEKPVITVEDVETIQGKSIDLGKLAKAYDKEDGDLTSKITYEGNVDFNKPDKYKVTYKVKDNNNQEVSKTITVTVLEDMKPVIEANDVYLVVGDSFNEKAGVKATDKEDKDLTDKIKVTYNDVNTTKEGTYKVTYQVSDSFGHVVTKDIKVIVEKEKTLEEKRLNEGEFYLESLTFDKNKKKYLINGYLIIKNIDNKVSTNIKYEFVLKDKNSDKTYSFNVDRQLNDVPFELGFENGLDYNGAWFKGYIDFNIDNLAGDYDLYMRASTNNYYAEEKVTNVFNKDIARRSEDDNYGYNFRVNLESKMQEITLNVRKGSLITTGVSNTYRNMFNNYDNIEFVDNKLRVVGTSYNYDVSYTKDNFVERKLILENTSTFKQYSFDLGYTTNGSYVVNVGDNKDKSLVWYDKNIDISKVEKGTYAIIVYTKMKDVEDYGEMNDIFGSINEVSASINDKNYQVVLNTSRNNRIELIVK